MSLNLFGQSEEVIDTKDAVVRSIMGNRLPWQVKWKPKTRDEMILPEAVAKQIAYQLSTSGLKNMTFHAGPGVGKTTLAMLIGQEMGCPVRLYNGSQMRVETIREEILPCGLRYVVGPPTLIILDECDRAGSDQFWDALRHAIDKTMEGLRFILTGNYVYNIPEPILSRCPPISFQHDDQSLKRPLFNRLLHIAKTETEAVGGTYELDTIKSIAKQCYPDIRRMINELERNFDQNAGSIIGTPRIGNAIHMEELFKYILAGDDKLARMYFNEHFTDFGMFFVEFCDYVQEKCEKKHRLDVGTVFAEYNFRSTSQVNQEMNVTRGLFGHLIKMLGQNG